MGKITPQDKNHARLIIKVSEYLEEKNYLVDDAAYHDTMPELISKRLSQIYTPTSMYIRGRADRIAVHKTKDIVFEWDAKTSAGSKNCNVELYPIINHIMVGAKCLYAYKNKYTMQEVGFWIDKLPPIEVIIIPSRWDNHPMGDWYYDLSKKYFDAEIKRGVNTGGSGDPYIILDIRGLPHWKELIQENE